MQRERKLRLYSGLNEPALDEWIEEARDCISTQRLEGEAAVRLLVSYLDGAARSEIRCQPNYVRKDANKIIGALEDVYGERRLRTNCCNDFSSVDRWLACPPLRIHTGWLRSPAGSIAWRPKPTRAQHDVPRSVCRELTGRTSPMGI